MPDTIDFATATVSEAKQELRRLSTALTVENTPETLVLFEQVFRTQPHLHPAVTEVPTVMQAMTQQAKALEAVDTSFDGTAYREQALPLLRLVGPIYEREVQPY